MKKQIATTDNHPDEAEALLRALIAECRDVIHDVILPSALATQDDISRRFCMSSMVELVRVGALVGDTIARLRGGGAAEQRQRITVERIQRLSTDRGEGV